MLASQLLLVLAACALGGASLRAAGRIADGGLAEELIAAAPLAGGFAVCWTLALGLAGLSGSALALAGGALLAWVAARVLIPRGPSLTSRLHERWQQFSRGQRAAALGLVGLAAACALAVAREPALGNDALWYHLADVAGWLHSGHAGDVQRFSSDYPFGYYPITGEVLLTWVLGISRSFAPLAIWGVGVVCLTLLALWRLLGCLRVPRTVMIAAVAAFATLPMVAQGLTQDAAGTDVLALMWLLCVAALCVRAPARPQLLGPALLAAGLGAGTKTTVIPLAAVVLVAAGWLARRGLGAVRPWLLAGAIGGLVVAAPWYLRNTFVHGWPLWPFESAPGGTPVPHFLSLFHESFLSRPRAAINVLGSLYLKWVAGGLALIAGVVLIPFAVRSRAVLFLTALATGSLLVWAISPFTGLSRVSVLEIAALSTVRYLLPAFAACTVAIAVSARDGGPVWRRLVLVLLLAATVGSIVADAELGHTYLPRLEYPLIGGLVGALIGAVTADFNFPRVPELLRVGVPALAIAFLALSAPHWLWRQSTSGSYDEDVLGVMLRQPGFASGSQPISFAPDVLAALAGPRLKHPIELIPARESCARTRARLEHGWVVILLNDYQPGITTPFYAFYCLIHQHAVYATRSALIFGPTA